MHVAVVRPLAFPDADRLTRVWLEEPGVDSRRWLSIPEARELEAVRSFDVFLITARIRAVVLFAEVAERLRGEAVNRGYFEMLGIDAAVGRLIQSSDFAPDAPPVIVLSYGTWLRGFAADPGVRPIRTERG